MNYENMHQNVKRLCKLGVLLPLQDKLLKLASCPTPHYTLPKM